LAVTNILTFDQKNDHFGIFPSLSVVQSHWEEMIDINLKGSGTRESPGFMLSAIRTNLKLYWAVSQLCLKSGSKFDGLTVDD